MALASARAAVAHGFGERYELPLPLGLYLAGAAAVVALSFLTLGIFFRRPHGASVRPAPDLRPTRSSRWIGHPAVGGLIRLVGLAAFILTVLAGLLGDQNPYRNIAPTLVWIVWWVGLALLAALVGDLWHLLNPWRTVYDAAARLYRWLGRGNELSLRLPYPRALGVWPACGLLLAFAWVELVDPLAAAPAHIAVLAITYSVLTWCGMLAFGRDTWLQHGEVFTLVFGTFGRFAPTDAGSGRLRVRPPGAGLLEGPPVSTSMTAFVLLLLAAVLYDGLIGTGEWAAIERELSPPLDRLVLRTLGLPMVWLTLLAAYLGVCAVMSALAGGAPRALDVARAFALTLVPIAIGYHVAHYLVFLLVQGQYIIPLLSDPFGWGWDLLGTAGYRVDIGLVGARFAWYTTLAAIVVGHVAAVYLAHVKSFSVFAAPAAALRVGAPLTALMVVYTCIGLSIAAEPIVESRPDLQPSAVARDVVTIPPDAVAPRAPDGRFAAVGGDATAKVKLTYKVLGSAFHDGTRTSMADLLYAYAFAYRWGVGGADDRYDAAIDAATSFLRRHLIAVRPIGVDAGTKSFRVGDVDFVREVLTVEAYLALAPDDPEWNAVVAPPWSTLPWHLLVLMEEAVTRGWAAFSRAEAVRRGIPWLDVVRSGELNARLATLAAELEREGFRPEALRPFVDEAAARRRWGALLSFYKSSGHFLITNGPYKLARWTPTSVTLEAFRDLTYPLGVGSYDAYAIPRHGFITKAEWNGARLTLSADIEVVETFQRSHRLVRTPLQHLPVTVLRRAQPQCRYVVTDPVGNVTAVGVATPAADATFQIDLNDRLPPGRYTLAALIAVNGNVVHAHVHRVPLVVSSAR